MPNGIEQNVVTPQPAYQPPVYEPPPAYQPVGEQPKGHLLRYLIIGLVVLVLAVGIAFAFIWRSRHRGAGTNRNMPPLREPTTQETSDLGLPEGAKLQTQQTPDGPTDVIVFPDYQGAPPAPAQ